MMITKRIKDALRALYYTTRAAALVGLSPFVSWRSPRFDPDQIKKILVIRLDRLGDLALTLPLLAALKQRWPSAELTVLCRDAVAPLLQAQPEVDRAIVVRRTKGRSARLLRRDERAWMLRQLRADQFDLVIDPFSGEELDSAWIAWQTGARHRLGFSLRGRGLFFTRSVAPNPAHSFLEQQQALAAAIGVELRVERPRLVVTADERTAAAGRLRDSGLDPARPIIGIHPGGYYPTQRWPLGRFLALAKRLVEEDHHQVVFFGTRAEERLIAHIGMPVGVKMAVCFGLELREFIALLSVCRLMVCNNSGPLHVATALGLPTVSTIGPTDPVRWWPVGDGHQVVRKSLWCSPCQEGECPLGTQECLMTISVEEMLAAVRAQAAGLDKASVAIPIGASNGETRTVSDIRRGS